MKPLLRMLSATIFIGIICMSVLFTGCSRPGAKNELVVGMDLSYPPFESLDPNGSPAGISVDMVRDLGKYLHRPTRIENIPFVGLIPALRTNKIDVVVSSMTDTPQRRRSIAFSEPYLSIGLACLTKKGLKIQDAKELNLPSYNVAVRKGTTAQLWAGKNLPKANILTFEKEGEAVREVVQGKADVFIYDQMSIWRYGQLNRDKCGVMLTPLTREYWAMGLRLSDTVLLNQVNAFLKAYRLRGGFEKLGDRYLSEQKRAFHEAGIPLTF